MQVGFAIGLTFCQSQVQTQFAFAGVSHPNSLGPFAFERLQRRLSVDCRQRTGTRTSVSAGKRKLKMQFVGWSATTHLSTE